MNRSKLLKDRPLEKGQQTLTAFFSKAGSVKTVSKCPVCLKEVSTPQLNLHKKNCTVANQKRPVPKDDSDSDIEIIEDTKTPIKKTTAPLPLPSASRRNVLEVKKDVPDPYSTADVPRRSTPSKAAGSVAGAPTSTTSSPAPSSDVANPSTTAEPSIAGSAQPLSSTPMKEDDVPVWGQDSPQISDVIGGAAAAFCETMWSNSSSVGERSAPNTPQLRCKAVGPGGWLVSPTRSPSVSPSGRVRESPGDVTPGRPLTSSPAAVTSSPAGRLASPGARVRLSPAVAGRMGRFALSGLNLPAPTGASPSRNQSPAKGRSPRRSPAQRREQGAGKSPSRSQSKSPGRWQGKSPGGQQKNPRSSPFMSPGSSPLQSPNRRLPKTNPLRYLNSPGAARRRLYRTTSGEVPAPASPAATASSRSATGDTVGHSELVDFGSPNRLRVSAREGDQGKERENEGGGSKKNGLVRLADVGLLRCDSDERMIGNFRVDSDNAVTPCSPLKKNSVSNGREPASDPIPPGDVVTIDSDSNGASAKASMLTSESARSSTRTLTADADAELNLSVEEEEILSQEFSTEMPEVALLSPQKSDSSQPYYLQNFLFIINSVLSDDLHTPLLDDDDLNVISSFRSLPAAAQMLYVRMFQRKHAWLRPEKLRYTEIGDESAVNAALDALAAEGLVETERQLTGGVVQLAELLPAPELRQLCQQLHLTATGPRPDLLARLAELDKKRGAVMFGATSPAEVAARRARTLLGRCVRVASAPRRVLLRVLSLFHLPLYEDEEDTSQQLLTLLMVNLGRMVYPPVTVSRQTAIFATRDDLLRYETASQLERQLRNAIETKQWDAAYETYQAAETMLASLKEAPELAKHDASLPPFLRRFTAGSIITYVMSKSVEVLQRRREHDAAVTLLRSLLDQHTYLPDYRGFWSDRLALTLHQHLRRPDEALQAVRSALEDPEVRGGRRLALEQRLARLEPTLTPSPLQPDHLPSVEIEARCLPRDVPGLKMVFLRPEQPSGGADVTGYVTSGDVTVCSVEELALSHYSSRYSEGVHREGAPTVTLFALLFWDLLYSAEVPDSFRSAYQTLPLDLNSPAFLERRREAVEARLAELEAGSEEDACQRVAEVWEAHHGCLSLASWDVFRDCEHALSLLRCLGVRLVTAICRRLATEYRFTRSGFPDLVLWNPSTLTARIVEVKGPNDRLSTKQILWIQYLLDHGAEAEVCYVKALGRRGAGKRKTENARGKGEEVRSPRKRRARGKASGRKACDAGADDVDYVEGDVEGCGSGKPEEVVKRKRGRPRKIPEGESVAEGGAGVGRAKRGRPRKSAGGPSREETATSEQAELGVSGSQTRRESAEGAGESAEGRGRGGSRGVRGRRGRGGRAGESTKRARQSAGDGEQNEEPQKEKRPRGRPRKNENLAEGAQEEASQKEKRTRGRPRKKEEGAHEVEVVAVDDSDDSSTEMAHTASAKRDQSSKFQRLSSQMSFWSTEDSSGSDFT
ncbi:fanconi-associated nuclease 1-like [Amphibalanus amphitrite]|uniref:fanconi-associated nuclease 1-like n=1 Tax=Amphibalanus amphitrite TaxID=1232801 RepID=UPI001C92A584|nr:fanconi-associated nuclease 1-like [Amphibalanus amphitrite]XP_043192005.1 fanconi-associated nuclease 1-like [Amphibalanus amphitrite]XP_043192006.1 fanconi-associated nuclease 1-like [Amphibalanus amphitrite]